MERNVEFSYDDYYEEINDKESNINKHKKKSKKKHKKITAKEILREILIDSIYILVVMSLMLLVIKYVGQRTVVIGCSMQHTLEDQDSLIVDKISYRFKNPERFDIVVFPFQHANDTFYIKRVIGLPGETIQIDYDGNIYIDGEILEENYGFDRIKDPGIAAEPILIGENQYFVMGDNRNNSSDSRTIAVGLVDKDTLIGKAVFRIFPLKNIGKIK